MMSNVSQLVTISERQSGASEQISRNVQNISDVSAESAHGISLIAQTANELNEMMGELQKLIAKFNLDLPAVLPPPIAIPNRQRIAR